MSQFTDQQFINTVQGAFHEGVDNVANKLEEAANVWRVEEVFRLIARRDFKALEGICR